MCISGVGGVAVQALLPGEDHGRGESRAAQVHGLHLRPAADRHPLLRGSAHPHPRQRHPPTPTRLGDSMSHNTSINILMNEPNPPPPGLLETCNSSRVCSRNKR